MSERDIGQQSILSPQREQEFKKAEQELAFPTRVYALKERFEGLPSQLENVIMLDVIEVPGCHYGVKNVFVPIIHHLEQAGFAVGKKSVSVSPETSILVEPSTGNGWVAFSEAAERLGYEHIVIMPDGLPGARYQHPQGKPVTIHKTSAKDYAVGMPNLLQSLLLQNRHRLARGEKIYISPDHARTHADITVKTMAEIGRQLLANIADHQTPLRVVISMGNGASLCAIGEYVKANTPNAKVVATESFAYGGGYDEFAKLNDLPGYFDLFGIEPGTPALMEKFSAFGTNAPIGIDLPLQTRAINSLIDNYVLFTDNNVLQAYQSLQLDTRNMQNALELPNYSALPSSLIETYGNSTLANIAAAAAFAGKGEQVVAMAYDSRRNY